ncbi:MAG: hypothetical protein EG826_00145 [Deltaproteobacteria bacterium]|nr:hypothetical protein [Deltaproteobacteria bacterium]
MKRFWLVLLSLGLIVAFSTSAMAVDVKFTGEFYAAGLYKDKGAMIKDDSLTNTSTAFYFQRLRLTTQFVVSPGLTLTTRADIMERVWGGKRSDVPLVTSNDFMSAGTRAENENIVFDLAYVTYVSPIGIFLAGYQIDGAWGTVFGDSSLPTGKVGYMFRGGPITLGLQTGKNNDMSRTAVNAVNTVDRDSSFYTAYGIYSWKTGMVGLLFKYIQNDNARGTVTAAPLPPGMPFGNRQKLLATLPYIKAQLGPVFVQAEAIWLYGQTQFDDEADPALALAGRGNRITVNSIAAWIDATADFGKFYAGGTFAYLAGDDPQTTDKVEGASTGGFDWNPCLIMFNFDLTYWQGGQLGANGTSDKSPMSNAYFAQLRAGVRPVDKLDIMLSGSWAHADKTPTGATWQSRDYGYEVDLTATYKITNNLSYMLGGGYFFVGDWYKGQNALGTVQTQNQFIVLNKLTLTF